MKIRHATESDLRGIFDIYDHEIATSLVTFDSDPKSEDDIAQWWDSRKDIHPILVAEDSNSNGVIGWARLYSWSPRKGYDRTAESAVYIHHSHRGKGIGKALMKELLKQAKETNIIKTILCRVVDHPEGAPSVEMHMKLGFQLIGVQERVGVKFGLILGVKLFQLHFDM